MELSQIEKIGLKEKEARIYIALLQKGPQSANHIAKKTGILRSSIYDYLDQLLDKGFITYSIISGKKFFQAVDPQRVLDNFESQKRMEEETLRLIVPELSKLKQTAEKRAKVEVFEGKEGMKSAFSYILKDKPSEICIYGSSGVSFRLIPYFMEYWHKERIKQKIPIRIIYNLVNETRERMKSGPSMELMSVRFSPIKNLSLTGTIIYNDKVLITMWNPEAPLAILIQSKEIGKDYSSSFEVLWRASTPRQ